MPAQQTSKQFNLYNLWYHTNIPNNVKPLESQPIVLLVVISRLDHVH